MFKLIDINPIKEVSLSAYKSANGYNLPINGIGTFTVDKELSKFFISFLDEHKKSNEIGQCIESSLKILDENQDRTLLTSEVEFKIFVRDIKQVLDVPQEEKELKLLLTAILQHFKDAVIFGCTKICIDVEKL